MRRTVQVLVLALFTSLFFWNRLAETTPLPAGAFLQLDPLLTALSSTAARALCCSLVPALLLIGATILAGRFFCGYMCPLGTVFDLAPHKPASMHMHRMKYVVLAMLAGGALAGLNLAGIIDPLALLTRGYTFLLYPLSALFGNVALDAMRPAAEQLRLYPLARHTLAQPVFFLSWLTVVILAALLYLNWRSHRFWCANLCPLGALLGLAARCSVIRRRVSSACTQCSACARVCPTGAIPRDMARTATTECIVCGACATVCPVAAISFFPGGKRSSVQPLRRALLGGLAGGVALAIFGRITPTPARTGPSVLRPPGAVPEERFLRLCVRCGHCMKACPTNTLQPCLLEAGLPGIWSPQLLPRLAGCAQDCTACGAVCPTGAIRALTLDEKKYAKTGTAEIDRNRCLVWTGDRLCLICDEQCPYDAIVFRWSQGSRRPHVNAARCNGCGFCEQQCPVDGNSAIRVSTSGSLRLAQGSYRERARRLGLDLEEAPGDERFFLPREPAGSDLPQGFNR